jgi:hypothetical protein
LFQIVVNQMRLANVVWERGFETQSLFERNIKMRINLRPGFKALGLFLLIHPGLNAAQPQSASAPSRSVPVNNSVTTQQDVAETREKLLALLRLSPTLTDVVASDPSLLANQDYVNRNNPELETFLQRHPEVVRNPDFYLFANLPSGPGRRGDRLVRRTWMGEPREQSEEPAFRLLREVGPFIILVTLLGTLLWLIRILLENRRWGRIFKMQTEVHGRLIEKLGNNEELISYMNTEAGRRFLEAAPIPVDFERDQRVPAALSRVLAPLQIGIVLTLLGAGLLALRNNIPEVSSALLVFGIVILMPGVGFIISAGITWLLAARLGLMPHNAHRLSDSGDRP